MTKGHTAHLDRAIGARVCLARVQSRLSQTALGKALGISFQQVQKYERGKDRIAASRLFALAEVLGKAPAWFLEVEGVTPVTAGGIPAVRATASVAAAIQAIPDERVRRCILGLAEEISRGGMQTAAADASAAEAAPLAA